LLGVCCRRRRLEAALDLSTANERDKIMQHNDTDGERTAGELR
jgi:hypothetical protein